MQTTYGIFDDEADRIDRLVHNHVSLAVIRGTRCPACGAALCVASGRAGPGFALRCSGDPMHITKDHAIEGPPPWWQQCYAEPQDTAFYWHTWHGYKENGALFMKISGYLADGVHWSGEMDCPPEHEDFELWQWVIHES